MNSIPKFSDPSKAVIQSHAKSFSWASRLLPRESLADVRALYHFCRYADDVADNLPAHEARARLSALKSLLDENGPGPTVDPEAKALISRLLKQGVRREWMVELIRGVESDLESIVAPSYAEFLVYCYRVAGVVGLMMCPLIGVRDSRAFAFAIDLGIAMQMTNIARDVAEDAGRGRVYLPKEWLDDLGVGSHEVLRGEITQGARRQLMRRLLVEADRYYISGSKGLRAIPWQPRLAIAVASRLYRAIGGELERQNLNPWKGRVFVPFWKKLALTVLEVAGQARVLFKSRRLEAHESRLHAPLRQIEGLSL